MSKPVTFPSGLTLVEARELFSGVVVSVGVFDLSDDGKPGKMLFPPRDKVITNLTADRVILDGGTRGHTSINIASGASVPKAGTVTLIAPPQAARLRDLLGVASGPMPSPPPPRRVETKAVKALLRDLTERNPIDDTRLTLPERVVMVPHGMHITASAVMDTLHDLRTDALALHVAALDTLSRVPACPCGAVSTVCDLKERRYLCVIVVTHTFH